MSGLETILYGALSSLVAALLAVLGIKWVERKLTSGYATHDVLQDVLLTCGGIEMTLAQLLKDKEKAEPACASDINSFTGEWLIASPGLGLEYVMNCDDAKVHQLAIKYYDNFERLRVEAQTHEAAYWWLLESKTWDGPLGGRKKANFGESRDAMIRHSRLILRRGYEIADCLCDLIDHSLLHQYGQPSLTSFLSSNRLDSPDVIRRKAAFYRLRLFARVFDPTGDYALIRWEGSAADEAFPKSARLQLHISYAIQEKVELTDVLTVAPLEVVALPRQAVLQGVVLVYKKQEHSLSMSPLRVSELPNRAEGHAECYSLRLDDSANRATSRVLK